MNDIHTWTFPESISFEDVPDFMDKFNCLDSRDRLLFDLRETKRIHSSFIGFLLHIKNRINRNGGSLTIHVSEHVERVLDMLELIDHFSPEITGTMSKKTA